MEWGAVMEEKPRVPRSHEASRRPWRERPPPPPRRRIVRSRTIRRRSRAGVGGTRPITKRATTPPLM